MLFFLQLRFRQIHRLLRHAGWGILLFLLLVTAGVWLPQLERLAQAPAYALSGAGIFLAGYVHLGRKDVAFLYQTSLPAGTICLLDLVLVLTPGVLFFLAVGNPSGALAFGSGLATLALPPGLLAGMGGHRTVARRTGVPLDLFEWRSAARRHFWGWLVAAALQAGVWFHLGFFLAAVALTLVLVSAVFDYAEPAVLLPAGRAALLRKWRRYALCWHLFLLPAYGQGLLAQSVSPWLVLYAAGALEVLLAWSYFYKYARWRPGRVGGGGIAPALGLLLVLLPGGILAVFPMACWAMTGALRRMRDWA